MPPNIIFVLLDTARAANLSSYGYHRETTPFLKSLAEGGVQYNRAFANSIFSLPSYGSMFTGEYPTNHRAVDWNSTIEKNTLVNGLNKRGYATKAVSTHLVSGEFGIADAFDDIEVQLVSNDLMFENDPVVEELQKQANREGWDTKRELSRDVVTQLLRHPSPKSIFNLAYMYYDRFRQKQGHWSDNGASYVLEGARKMVRNTEEPFFLFCNFVETHAPYKPPEDYIYDFMPTDVSFEEIQNALDYSSDLACLGEERISDRQQEILTALYDAELRYLDDQLKQFYQFLTNQNVADDTVFVVVSDHGDFFGKQGLWGHQGRVYNDVCHVPLIISYPWETGREEDGIVELRQLCSHLHAIADGEQHCIEPNGEALVEYYGLDTQIWYTPSERFDHIDSEEWETYECALIDNKYKLIWNANSRVEFYDMVSDFAETTDISSDYPKQVSVYQKRVVDLVGEPEENHDRYRGKEASERDMEGDVENRLRELGYLE